MLRSILVGVDTSEDCTAAVELGIKWALRFDCLLVGIGVIDEPSMRGSQSLSHMTPSYKVAYEQMLAEARRGVEQSLQRFALRCSEAQVACKLLEDEGQPCEQIMHDSQRYDIVLLGRETHFEHGSEGHSCKTLEKILHCTPRPVVVVPKGSGSGGGGVLVAYDGSLQAARAMQSFLNTGLHALGDIHIISIHPNSSVKAAVTADRAVEFLRFHEIPAKAIPIFSPEPPGKLFLGEAAKLGADLVVMGAHGQAKFAEFFLGSATRTALKHSRVPLFLYH